MEAGMLDIHENGTADAFRLSPLLTYYPERLRTPRTLLTGANYADRVGLAMLKLPSAFWLLVSTGCVPLRL
jgi:hypothetical protein